MATLEERRQRAIENRRAPVGENSAPFREMTANRFLGNLANVPDLAANLGARAINYAAKPFDIAAQFAAASANGNFSEFQNPPPLIDTPPIGQDFVPGPSGEDLMGVVQRVGEVAGAVRTLDFDHFVDDPAEYQRQRQLTLAEENPSKAIAANISGDLLTLLTGRAPISSARGLSQLQFAKQSQLAAASANTAKTAAQLEGSSVALAPDVVAGLRAVGRGKNFKFLMNRLGRAGEAGVEGLTLAALNGEADPMTTAGFAAGTQAGSSLLLAGVSKILTGGPLGVAGNLVVASAVGGGLVQFLKSGTFGGEDYILPSLESGFDKTLIGLALGATASILGQGRITSGFPVKMIPDIADSITVLGRGSLMSVVTEWMEDPAVAAVMNKVQTNPDYFTPTEQRRLDRAFKDENISMSETINDLMQNKDFAERYNNL